MFSMVKPLKQWEEEARAKAQKFDISRRKRFLELNQPTQQKVIEILEKAESILHKETWVEAQQYVLGTIFDDKRSVDRSGVRWTSVEWQIRDSCFTDSEWEGLKMVPRRVGSELTVFRSLMEDKQKIIDRRDEF